MAKKSTRSSKTKNAQKKAQRRQAQFDRCHSQEAFEHERAKREQAKARRKERFASSRFSITANGSDILADLAEKARKPYEVWSSIYQPAKGTTIPFIFFADGNLPLASQYLNYHRSEVYAFIEDTYRLYEEEIKENGIEYAVVITKPSDGEEYGIAYMAGEDFVKVGKALARNIGEHAEKSVFIKNNFSASHLVVMPAA